MIAIRRFALLTSVLLPGPAAAQTPNPFLMSAEELLHDWRTGANQNAVYRADPQQRVPQPVIDTATRSLRELRARDPDVKGLTFVIVEALEQDGGFGSGAQWPPVVTGPVVIDTARLRDVYEFSYGAAVADSIIHELALAGYAFGDFTSLRRSRVNSSGITEHWLDGDPLLVRFDALGGGDRRAEAFVSYFYNYQDHLCARRFVIDLRYTDSQWQILARRLIGQC